MSTAFYYFILLWLIISPTPSAWAYIDPGTSGFAFSFLGPIIAALGGFLALFFRPIWNLFRDFYNKHPKTVKIVILMILTCIVIAGGCFFLWEEKEICL